MIHSNTTHRGLCRRPRRPLKPRRDSQIHSLKHMHGGDKAFHCGLIRVQGWYVVALSLQAGYKVVDFLGTHTGGGAGTGGREGMGDKGEREWG